MHKNAPQPLKTRAGDRLTTHRLRLLCFLGLSLATVCSPPANATQKDQPSLCERAAQAASQKTNVPQDVLLAVALTETGRRQSDGTMRPWPWASNQGGDGHWFETREAAESYVSNRLAEGVTNIDIGCFQLNHRWHARHFSSLSVMFDPAQNALYAAELLRSLYAETGDWSKAVGAYHSRTPEYATRYREKYDLILASVSGADPTAPDPSLSGQIAPRLNAFPFFLPGQHGSIGSIVPAVSNTRPLFEAQP